MVNFANTVGICYSNGWKLSSFFELFLKTRKVLFIFSDKTVHKLDHLSHFWMTGKKWHPYPVWNWNGFECPYHLNSGHWIVCFTDNFTFWVSTILIPTLFIKTPEKWRTKTYFEKMTSIWNFSLNEFQSFGLWGLSSCSRLSKRFGESSLMNPVLNLKLKRSKWNFGTV